MPSGQVGELIVRAEMPWTISHGYRNHAEATARTWRNGWFHTGDAFRRDEAGAFYFVDRIGTRSAVAARTYPLSKSRRPSANSRQSRKPLPLAYRARSARRRF